MAVASYLQCRSSPSVSHDFAILGTWLEQFKFLEMRYKLSINRIVKSGAFGPLDDGKLKVHKEVQIYATLY